MKLKLLFCILILSITPINALDDSISGFFDCASDCNVPPVFTDWYGVQDTVITIDPIIDVDFFVIIYDPDNSSSEVTLTMYYSNDSFVANNNSLVLEYDSTPSFQHFKYNYTLPGQVEGTVWQYYYQANSTSQVIRKPFEGFLNFDIQWNIIEIVGEPPPVNIPGGKVSEIILVGKNDKEERRVTDFILLLFLVAVIGALIRQEYLPDKKRKPKGSGLPGKTRAKSVDLNVSATRTAKRGKGMKNLNTRTNRKTDGRMPSAMKSLYTRFRKRVDNRNSPTMKKMRNNRDRRRKR